MIRNMSLDTDGDLGELFQDIQSNKMKENIAAHIKV